MHRNTELIFIDSEFSSRAVSTEACWTAFNESASFFKMPVQDPVRFLANLVYEIQRHPKNLKAHIQRIFLCYQENMVDPLYGALVDFLIVLDHKGRSISRRMVSGALSKLSDRQGSLLKGALTKQPTDHAAMIEGNHYSIFCRGLSGTLDLVGKSGSQNIVESDPLKLAQDAVEYSQLDEAIEILETALTGHPRTMKLHLFLLELYKSTMNQTRFEATLSRLQTMDSFVSDNDLQAIWSQLKDYFDHKCHE